MAESRPGPGRAADRAYAEVRAAILQGELRPGTMLSENELAARLGTSRTPVRAALTRLQDEGWVTIYPQRGVLVRELSEREVREAAEVRHALESAGVQLAAGRPVAARLGERLAANVEEQARALAAREFAAFAGCAMRFHRAFVEMSGNELMLGVYDRLQDLQYLSIVRSAERIAEDPEAVLAAHRELLEDVRRGDWAAFADHLAAHQARSHGVGAP